MADRVIEPIFWSGAHENSPTPLVDLYEKKKKKNERMG
jgi:hypothetical protein